MNTPKTQNDPGGAATPARAENDHQVAEDTARVQRGYDLSHALSRRRYPAAHVSLYAPHRGRRTWWFAYRCEHCGYGHQGHLRSASDEDSAMRAVQGVRRSRCGKRVWIVVARVYRGQQGVAA